MGAYKSHINRKSHFPAYCFFFPNPILKHFVLSLVGYRAKKKVITERGGGGGGGGGGEGPGKEMFGLSRYIYIPGSLSLLPDKGPCLQAKDIPSNGHSIVYYILSC